ncbi:MAG TPA: MFS transporter, partial [Verrucomicrobiota bacterium]|nr:MFS transporter [Verrucomicrobiota bacterium]
YIQRVGYKQFVFAGWGTRVMFIFGIALVPLTGGFLDRSNQLALVIALLFCFNLSRGISSCAWLPWLTELVPPQMRGRFLVRDAATTNFGCFVAFLISAALLAGDTRPWQFSLLFAFSGLAGVASLTFLKRIPDVPIVEAVRASQTRVPWMAMIQHPPFKKLLRSVIAWSVAYGGMTAFTVAYLRVEVGLSETTILLVTSVAFLGGLSTLGFLGHRLDRLGSKPVLTFAFGAWILVLAGWVALAGRAVGMKLVLVLLLQFFMGLLAALVNMSNNRLAIVVIPKMGRNHFFALYNVVGNVTLGVAPIAWGILIDAIGSRETIWMGVAWNRYTIFFAGAAAAFVVAMLISRFLEEPEAVSMEELLRELLIQSPQRIWLRFWPRS